VHGRLGEDSRLAWSQGFGDESGTILLKHVRRCVAVDRDHIVGSTRVQVRRKHTAGTQVEHGHCPKSVSVAQLRFLWLPTGHAVALGCWKGGRIHVGDATRSKGVIWLLDVEVEKPIVVGGKKSLSVELGSSRVELCDLARISGLVDCHSILGEGSDDNAGGQSGAEHGSCWESSVCSFQVLGPSYEYVVL